MGGVMSKLGGVFNPTIPGTGQTAGDLSKIGYSPADLTSLDPKRALLKGIVGGIGKGLQTGPPPAQVGPGMTPAAPVAPTVDPRYFQPGDVPGGFSSRSPIYG